MPMEMPSSLNHLVDNNPEKTIKSYLERPYIVVQGSLDPTDTATTFTNNQLMLMYADNVLYFEKLKGFLGFKADIELTLVVNANRFQQGRYMLCYVPTCGGKVRSANHKAAYQNMHSANLTCRTQLHHVELDINCDTTAKLLIPFVSPYNSYPLNQTASSGDFDIGTARIFPYVPASSSCSFTLWGRFVNIELFGAALPQSGRIKARKSTQETERDSANVGPISGTLRKVQQAATELGRIPLLSSFTTPVSFVADVLANSAQIFGWSKPNVLNPQHVMLKDKMRYATTYDGSSTAAPLSLSVKNELQNVALVTDLDEMSWDYVKTIPAFYAMFDFSTSDAQAAVLYNTNLTYNMSVSNTFGTQATVTFLPCTLPSILFAKARGGFVVTVKCVKTEFHSGRLLMSVIPRGGFGVTPPGFTVDNSSYLHRTVIDIREGNQWSFQIPYQSIGQWRDSFDTLGIANIRFDVVDKLTAPSTVSSSIKFIIEVSGAEDLEFAFPKSTTYQPLAPAVIQSGCIKFNGTAGDSPPATQSVAPSAYCMGEVFTSFRQLLKRVVVTSYTSTTTGNEYNIVLPFAWSTNVAVAAAGSGSAQSMDMYTLMSSMYGLVRGSVRVGFATINSPTNSDKGCFVYTNILSGGTVNNAVVTPAATDNFGKSDSTYVGHSLVQFSEIDSNLVTGFVQVPGYYPCPAASTLDTMITSFAAYNDTYPATGATSPAICLNYKGVPYTTNAPTFIRSGADDMTFQMFISTTPLMDVPSAGAY